MKAKVVTENSRTTIYLTPENSFDSIVMEKFYKDKDKQDAVVNVTYGGAFAREYTMQIDISQKEIKEETF